jgi:hypothetical protein
VSRSKPRFPHKLRPTISFCSYIRYTYKPYTQASMAERRVRSPCSFDCVGVETERDVCVIIPTLHTCGKPKRQLFISAKKGTSLSRARTNRDDCVLMHHPPQSNITQPQAILTAMMAGAGAGARTTESPSERATGQSGRGSSMLARPASATHATQAASC